MSFFNQLDTTKKRCLRKVFLSRYARTITSFRIFAQQKSGTALLLFRYSRLSHCLCIRTSNTEPTLICTHTHTRI